MEIKNNPTANEQTEQFAVILKPWITNFLISYFDYLTLIWVLIVLIAGLFLFVYPQYQKMSKSDDIAKQDLAVEQKNWSDYLSEIGDLKKIYQPISEINRGKIEAMVPADDKVVNLIPEVESIILRNSAVLDSIRIESAAANGQPQVNTSNVEAGAKSELPAGIFSEQLPEGVGLVKIEINLSSANYYILKNIIKTIENNLRLLDIATVNYDPAGDKASLIIYTYYLLKS